MKKRLVLIFVMSLFIACSGCVVYSGHGTYSYYPYYYDYPYYSYYPYYYYYPYRSYYYYYYDYPYRPHYYKGRPGRR